jgi:hypothetical protein
MSIGKWISITKVFDVECNECGLIDQPRSYKKARQIAAQHKRTIHPGTKGMTIGGTWIENVRRTK